MMPSASKTGPSCLNHNLGLAAETALVGGGIQGLMGHNEAENGGLCGGTEEILTSMQENGLSRGF